MCTKIGERSTREYSLMDYISRHLNSLFSQALTIFLFLLFFNSVDLSKSIYLCIYPTPRENYVFILNAIRIISFASPYSENTSRLKVSRDTVVSRDKFTILYSIVKDLRSAMFQLRFNLSSC